MGHLQATRCVVGCSSEPSRHEFRRVESTFERGVAVAGQEHLPPGLPRLSVGLDHVEDLWNDMTRAIRRPALDLIGRPQRAESVVARVTHEIGSTSPTRHVVSKKGWSGE